MIARKKISVYTPGNTDPETRERIFVQRHRLLEQTVKWIEESMVTGNKNHLLFIGPRGSGKTHLVAMAQNRLVNNIDLAGRMRIAWLGEESTITGLIDLALGMADELSREYPHEFEFDYRGRARSLSADDAAEAILNEIVDRLGDKTILLIMENLDRAFGGLGDLGQKKWRAFLQEKGRIATLATSQQLFEGVSSRLAAFFGFFDIVHLEPLLVEDARELMSKIAKENERPDLVEFLSTPEGRYRVRALHHLAGGNHRLYILLSEFLTKESIDDLVESFEDLAEDLTPYFQERLRSLSPQQARIVQSLCGASGALTVSRISDDTFISHRNVSRQLVELRQKGYVISEKRGKNSFYEMAEPLMRLCLEVKQQRGKPLHLVVAFLRAWYAQKRKGGEGGPEPDMMMEKARSLDTMRMAIQSEDTIRTVLGEKLKEEFLEHIFNDRLDDALSVAEETAYVDRPEGHFRRYLVMERRKLWPEALKELSCVLDSSRLERDRRALALLCRGRVYGEIEDFEKAVADCSAVLEMKGISDSFVHLAYVGRGFSYSKLKETRQGVADYTSAIEMEAASSSIRSVDSMPNWLLPGTMEDARYGRAKLYKEAGDHEKAIIDLTALIDPLDESDGRMAFFMMRRGRCYSALGDYKKGISDQSAVIEKEGASSEEKMFARIFRGIDRCWIESYETALQDFTFVIESEDVPYNLKEDAFIFRGLAYLRLCEYDLSMQDFNAVIRFSGATPGGRTIALFGLSEAAIPARSLQEFLDHLEAALSESDREDVNHGGPSAAILQRVLLRDSGNWEEYVQAIISVYARHGALNPLGTGLVRCIAVLDSSGYSNTQLDLWNSSWQNSGRAHDELAIALPALDAAIRVIKSFNEKGANDQPLLELPLEIRKIVRPLLSKSLPRS